MHWFCDKCNHVVQSIDRRLKSVDLITESLGRIESVIENLPAFSNFEDEVVKPLYSQAVTQVTSAVISKVEKNISLQEKVSKQVSQLQEEITAESRARNLVLFGITESDNLMTKVDEILKECSLSKTLTKDRVYRLGPKGTGKNRPVKICLDSEHEKWEFIRRIHSQKISGVIARCDLSKEEQQQDFLLRQELKKARADNPSATYKIIRGKVVKTSN